jgi:RND family efflux transporter MFP subunit
LSAEPAGLEVSGRTQCIPTRKGIIAPAVLHPVEEVRVAVGDRVKKGQALVKLDDDEPQADVRAKQAALKNAQIAREDARRYLAAVEKKLAFIPEQKYHEIRVAALKAEMDERIAKAALESAEAELEHYAVTAPIDGIITWLDVHPGMVSRPGTTVWGEILDLREIDVRCDVTVGQADRVVLGQEAEIRSAHSAQTGGIGRVIFVGIVADSPSGLVPVLIRLADPQGRLRCGVPVQVRFRDTATAGGAK